MNLHLLKQQEEQTQVSNRFCLEFRTASLPLDLDFSDDAHRPWEAVAAQQACQRPGQTLRLCSGWCYFGWGLLSPMMELNLLFRS